METALTVAFIVAVTAFFKEQFGFSGRASLAAAFGVSLVVGLAPTLAAAVPALAPWITQLVSIIIMFVAAAGSVDAIKQFQRARAEPLEIKGAQPK